MTPIERLGIKAMLGNLIEEWEKEAHDKESMLNELAGSSRTEGQLQGQIDTLRACATRIKREIPALTVED
jgi:hypothetical protein